MPLKDEELPPNVVVMTVLCFLAWEKWPVVFEDMTGHLEDASLFMGHIKLYAKVKIYS